MSIATFYTEHYPIWLGMLCIKVGHVYSGSVTSVGVLGTTSTVHYDNYTVYARRMGESENRLIIDGPILASPHTSDTYPMRLLMMPPNRQAGKALCNKKYPGWVK